MKRVSFKIFATVILLAAISGAVMLLWNAIIPSVVGWGVVNYWQAMGLIILSRLFLGRVGGYAHHPKGGDKSIRKMVKGMSRDEREEYIKNYFTAQAPQNERKE